MTRKFFGTDGIRGRANNPTSRLTGLGSRAAGSKYGEGDGSHFVILQTYCVQGFLGILQSKTSIAPKLPQCLYPVAISQKLPHRF